MPDQVLTRDGPVSVPMDYQVPQGGELIPLMVNATLDGTAVASGFYGAVQIIAPSGRVMGTAITSNIAAGASRAVSWFPGLGGQAAASSLGGLMAVRVNIVGDQSVAQGDPGTVVSWGEAPFDTGSPAPFWDAGTPTLLTAPVAGVYLSAPNPIWDVFAPGIAVDAEVAFYLYAGGQTPDGFHALSKESESPQGATHFTFSGQHHALTHLNAGDTVKINAYFNQGTSAVAALKLKDLRTVGYSTLVTSWSMVLVAAT